MHKINSIRLERTDNLQYFIGFLCLTVYAGSLFFPLMDKDAAHHANIALHMYEHNDYVSLVDRGKDYLDKPHLLFWTSALSFKIFGINSFAHRLPALLFALLSLFSIYRLTRHLADTTLAKIATILLATAQAFILSIMDARMETPLTAFIIFGLWQLIVYIDKGKFLNLLLAALGAALAFSTKGWLGPVIIFVSSFFYILLNRKWKILSRPQTWLFIPLFFLFISPVLYAYYLQYDLHPEKIVRGRSGRSGVKFILWSQLFERASGFDEGGRNSSYFFLYHTFLWAFFPWSFFAYAAVVFWIRRMIVFKKWKHPFLFAAFSFAFFLFTISFSKFKMPHYIIMLLPLAALFTAPYLRAALRSRPARVYFPLQMGLAILILLVACVLNFYFFPPATISAWVYSLAIVLILAYLFLKKFPGRGIKTFVISIAASLGLNLLLNYHFFPDLMQYQAGQNLAGQLSRERPDIADSSIILIETQAHSFDFSRGHNHRVIEAVDFSAQWPAISQNYFLVSPYLRNYIASQGFRPETIMSREDYNVATITLKFLNPATRSSQADSLMLVKFYKP